MCEEIDDRQRETGSEMLRRMRDGCEPRSKGVDRFAAAGSHRLNQQRTAVGSGDLGPLMPPDPHNRPYFRSDRRI